MASCFTISQPCLMMFYLTTILLVPHKLLVILLGLVIDWVATSRQDSAHWVCFSTRNLKAYRCFNYWDCFIKLFKLKSQVPWECKFRVLVNIFVVEGLDFYSQVLPWVHYLVSSWVGCMGGHVVAFNFSSQLLLSFKVDGYLIKWIEKLH